MEKSVLITPEKPVLVLRVCGPDGGSTNGFYWPLIGPVICPDWVENKECGHGLHGWLEGVGNYYCAKSDLLEANDSRWFVVEVPSYVELDGKIKFPSGTVVYSGSKGDATNYLQKHGCKGTIIGATVLGDDYSHVTAGAWGIAIAGNHGTALAEEKGVAEVGDYGTATTGSHGKSIAGYRGTSTAGYHSTATAGEKGVAKVGNYGTATAGDHGTSIAGYLGTAKVGDHGTAKVGNYGTATAGDHGTATASFHGKAIVGEEGIAEVGEYGTATAGNHGKAIAGYRGIAIAGDYGTAIAGLFGFVKAGRCGIIQLRYHAYSRKATDHLSSKGHITGRIGVDLDVNSETLKPNIIYALNNGNQFVIA